LCFFGFLASRTLAFFIFKINGGSVNDTNQADRSQTENFFSLVLRLIFFSADFVDVLTKKKNGDGVYYVQKQNNNWRTEFSGSPVLPDVPENVERWGETVFGAPTDAVNFWMGDDTAFSSLHKDYYENLYCVVRGQKVSVWSLLPPRLPFLLSLSSSLLLFLPSFFPSFPSSRPHSKLSSSSPVPSSFSLFFLELHPTTSSRHRLPQPTTLPLCPLPIFGGGRLVGGHG
jgi:hypothetical protein